VKKSRKTKKKCRFERGGGAQNRNENEGKRQKKKLGERTEKKNGKVSEGRDHHWTQKVGSYGATCTVEAPLKEKKAYSYRGRGRGSPKREKKMSDTVTLGGRKKGGTFLGRISKVVSEREIG